MRSGGRLSISLSRASARLNGKPLRQFLVQTRVPAKLLAGLAQRQQNSRPSGPSRILPIYTLWPAVAFSCFPVRPRRVKNYFGLTAQPIAQRTALRNRHSHASTVMLVSAAHENAIWRSRHRDVVHTRGFFIPRGLDQCRR
jgi:hypothetical protein